MQRLGERIKKRREYLEIHLNELAKRIGVSSSLLSQIENGKAYPSILNLKKIADGLTTTVAELIGENEPYIKDPVVRKEDRELVRQNAHGASLYLLANYHPSHLMEAYLVELEGGADTESLWESIPSQGFCFIKKGRVNLSLQSEDYQLGSGDSLYYAAHSLKSLSNPGDATSEVLFISASNI